MTEKDDRYSHVPTRDLKRRYATLNGALDTCTDVREYLICLETLGFMEAELKARGETSPTLF